MKNKIKIDLMSPSVSLNDLAQPQYNDIDHPKIKGD